MKALVPVSGFPAAMDAIRSNRQLGDQITLFLERSGNSGAATGGPKAAAAAGAADAGAGAAQGGAGGREGAAVEGQEQQPGGVFDSSLFDE